MNQVEVAPLVAGQVVAERYLLGEELGHGATGVVHAARDLRLERGVAIKLLRAERSGAVARERFAAEARAAARVQHPGVVTVYDWGEHAGCPFVVMECIRARSLAQQLEQDGTWGARRAIELVAQLCQALGAAHGQGVLHCDLKPSNVLLQDVGGVLVPRIVDFGSACLIEPSLAFDTGGRLIGSLPYMSYEQALGLCLDERTDVYALGCILYELLTGAPPFGRQGDGYHLKQAILNDPAPRLTCSDANLEAPLRSLLARALAKDPELRPASASSFARQLTHLLAPTVVVPKNFLPLPLAVGSTFVGRISELELLGETYRASRQGVQLVVIRGASGIGKTALLAHFEAHLRTEHSDVLLLRASCRGFEAGGFRAFDAAVHDLSVALSALPEHELLAYRPRRSGALCQLFPSLAALPSLAQQAERERLPPDLVEVRCQALAELGELLQRVSSTRGLVLFLDDVQWLDPDSATMLRALVCAEDAPNLMIACTERSGVTTPFALPLDSVDVELAGLRAHEAEALLRTLAPASDRREPLASLVQGCAGNPYLLTLVGRSREATSRGDSLSLEGAIEARYLALSEESRRLLEAVVLCRCPLPPRVIAAALGLERAATWAELAECGLTRGFSSAGQQLIEPYHGAVIAAVAPHLSTERRLQLHRALAVELRKHWPLDELALVEHTAASGNWPEAVVLASEAARKARDELAFERAARLYELSLQHYSGDALGRIELTVSMADALSNAGHVHAAATALLEASAAATPELAVSLRRRAGERFLASGDAERGLAALSHALSWFGLRLPVTPGESLDVTFQGLQRLVSRGLAHRLEPASEHEPRALERIDLHLSLARGLTYIDLRFLPYAIDGLYLALEAGEPTRLQRACALFVAGCASHLPNPLTPGVLALCRSLTERLGDGYSRALLQLAESELAHFEGAFLRAEAACEQAEHTLLQHCTGVWRELADTRTRAVLIQYSQKGDYRRMLPRSRRWLEEAVRREDRFYANWLRAAHALVWIAQDDAARARHELQLAEADWPGSSGVFEVAVALYLDVADRYLLADTAHMLPAQARGHVLASPASQTPFLKGYLHLHTAWGALRAFARGDADAEPVAANAVRELRGLDLRIWNACAEALDANLSFVRGEVAHALLQLEHAEAGFRELSMLAWAACVRRRRGQFMAGSTGPRLQAEADAQMRELGIVAPAKFAAAYFAPFALDPSLQATLNP